MRVVLRHPSPFVENTSKILEFSVKCQMYEICNVSVVDLRIVDKHNQNM